MVHCDPAVKAAIDDLNRRSELSRNRGGFESGFAVNDVNGTLTPGPIVTSQSGWDVAIPVTIGVTVRAGPLVLRDSAAALRRACREKRPVPDDVDLHRDSTVRMRRR
jgi:hypothetical protein